MKNNLKLITSLYKIVTIFRVGHIQILQAKKTTITTSYLSKNQAPYSNRYDKFTQLHFDLLVNDFQMFSQYQMQNLTPQYIDGYSGFNDDTFNDGDDTLQ